MGEEENVWDSPTPEEIARAVWHYYQQGFSIIPIKKESKQPNIPTWGQYQKQRAPREQIQAWLNAGLFENIGVITGDVSEGLDVFDLDDPTLFDNLGLTVDDIHVMGGWVVKTGRGHHLYFRNKHKCSAIEKPGGLHIERRGNGGYVIVPPSVHPSGAQYHFLGGEPGHDLVLTDTDSIWESLEKRTRAYYGIPEKTDDIPHCILAIMKGVPLGARDNVAYGYALHLKEQGLNRDETLQKLLTWNRHNKPPLDNNQIREKVHSAYKDDKTAGCAYWRNHGYCSDSKGCPIHKKNVGTFTNNQGKIIPLSVAEHILQGHTIITDRKTHDIYIYRDGYYHTNAEAYLEEIVQELLEGKTSTYLKNEIIGCVRGATYTDIKNMENTHMVNLENGIFDISTMTFLPHTPELFTITQLPVTYKPGLDCPQIKKFLSQVLPEGDIDTIQEIFGYCLLRNYRFQRAFMFIGEGANGKSTLLELLRIFLGKQNTSHVALQDLINHRFTRYELYGKLANIYPDLTSSTIKQTGIFKMLTGGDTLTADRKFREQITFVNYAKLVFSTNTLPPTKDETNAFYRRWILLNFPNKFEGANCDKHILDKITAPQELSGLLNYAIVGLARLLQNGDFTNSQTTEQLEEHYRHLSDPILYFLDESTINDQEALTPKEELYACYVTFCHAKNLPVKANNVFSRELKKHIPGLDEERPTRENGRIYCWRGIRILHKNTENGDAVQDVLAVSTPVASRIQCKIQPKLKKDVEICNIDNKYNLNKIAKTPLSWTSWTGDTQPHSIKHKQNTVSSITLEDNRDNGKNGDVNTPHRSDKIGGT